MSPPVSIVIVNYKNLKDTSECLRSIEGITYDNFNIIVVDNASNDGSLQELKKEFPRVLFIENSINLGFTGGNNAGSQRAYEWGAKYIFFLNNDTTVSSNILNELVLFLEGHSGVGLAGPLTCYYEDQGRVAFAGGNINRNTGLITFLKRHCAAEEIQGQAIYCNFIEGAALFIRADLMKELGGFNDDYFLTSEESELCVKIEDAGYRMAVLTTCRVWHKISQTMVSASELTSYFLFRNKLLFVRKNHKNFASKDLYEIVRYYCVCFLSFLIKKRNFNACKGLIWGVFDFLAGRVGVGRFKGKLQPVDSQV